MKRPSLRVRRALGISVGLGVLTAWLGACGSNGQQACGVGGARNGTCQTGPSCPPGQTEISIVDPFDMCPGPIGVCCASPDASIPDGSTGPGVDATSSGMDVTVGDAKHGMDVTSPVDRESGTPDTGHNIDVAAHQDSGTPQDTGAAVDADHDTGTVLDSGTHHDAGTADGGHDGGHDAGCGAAESCMSPSTCPTQATACIVNTCSMGCCGTTNASVGTDCTDNGGVVCNGNGSCVANHCADGVKDADETGVDCGGAQCDGLGDTCGTGIACGGNADCKSNFCGPGMVCALEANGQTCTSGSQCSTNHCVDGFCCDTPCNGACQACSAALTGGMNGVCTSETNGTSCTGTNLCEQTYTCQNGSCTGSNPVVCTASDQCHVAGTCSPATGLCTNPNASDGTACNDGVMCDFNDVCMGGVCSGTPCATGVCGTSLLAFNGTKTTGWNFEGDASYDAVANTVVLVDGSVTTGQAGTVVYEDLVPVTSLTVTFDFRFTSSNGRADGIAFMLETNGATALGASYGGFGVLGLTGYGVELDIFDSGPCDPGNGNHAGIDTLSSCTTNGGIPLPLATSGDLFTAIGAGDNGVGDIGDGTWRTATLTLSNGQMSVSISDPTTMMMIAVPNLQNVALPGFTPGSSFYLGFGGGSGSNSQASKEEIRDVSIDFGAKQCL